MSASSEYDEEAARRELAVYRTAPAQQRRATVRGLLDLAGDETVLSVGCGPGYEPAELADALDPEGRVLGVDASPAMLSLARDRCGDRQRISLARGDACSLPIATGAVDAATAVQVLEYLEEPEAALGELGRVLRSGGRAVLVDTDWRTFVWRADDEQRSQAVLDSWEERCPSPRIGSALAPALREAGFEVDAVEPIPIAERTLENSFFGRNLPFVVDHAEEALDPETALAWERDVRDRDRRGETFVSLMQYSYVARAP